MKVFVSFDGDHIGRMIGRASLADQPEEISRIAQAIERGNNIWQSWAESHGGKVINIGGDEGRLEVEADHLSELPKIRDQYQQAVGSTVSVGVGTKLSEADKSLMAAKLQGGDRIQLFTETVNELLEELQDKPEGEKIYEEYLDPDTSLHKAQPGMNPGAAAGFAGASQSHPAAPAAPREASEHSEAEVARGVLGVQPPVPGQPVDYEQMFHQAAEQTPPEEQTATPSGLADGVRAQVVKILQDVRSKAELLEQMRQTNPDLYESVKGLVQAMITMAQGQGGAQQPPQEMQKAEKVGQCKWKLGERRCRRLVTGNYCHSHKDHWANKVAEREEREAAAKAASNPSLQKANPPHPNSLVTSDALQEQGFQPRVEDQDFDRNFVPGKMHTEVPAQEAAMGAPRGKFGPQATDAKYTRAKLDDPNAWQISHPNGIEENDDRRMAVSAHNQEHNLELGRAYTENPDLDHKFATEVQNQQSLGIPDIDSPTARAGFAWQRPGPNEAWHTESGKPGPEQSGWWIREYGGPNNRYWNVHQDGTISPGWGHNRQPPMPKRDAEIKAYLENHLRQNTNTWKSELQKALPPETPAANLRAQNEQLVDHDALRERFATEKQLSRAPESKMHTETPAAKVARKTGSPHGKQATDQTYTRELVDKHPQNTSESKIDNAVRIAGASRANRDQDYAQQRFGNEDNGLDLDFSEEVQRQFPIPDLEGHPSFFWLRSQGRGGASTPHNTGWWIGQPGNGGTKYWEVMKDGTVADARPNSSTEPVKAHLESYLRGNPNVYKSDIMEKAALTAGKTGRHQVVLPVGAQIDSGPSADHEAGKLKVLSPDTGKTKWRSVRAGVVMAPDGTPTSSRNPGG